MSRGEKKELTAEEIKKQAIQKMLESLISGNSDDAATHLHDYLQIKTREIIMGESTDAEETVEEQSRDAAFAMSGKVMDDDVKGDVKFENGGKKTLKKHGNAPKELDDDKIEKTKFKNGGKKTLKKHGNAPKELDDDKIEHFDDGRDKELGTTKA